MKSIRELRQDQYEYRTKVFPYINDWKRCPYTCFKARLYMEASALLIFWLQRTRITPNTVTVWYGLLGLVGGILLAFGIKITVLAAVGIFFFKGILDWADGYLAKIKNLTSVAGDMLDRYGAILGALGFQMGLGFYVAQKSGMTFFYYLIPLIPMFLCSKLHNFATVVFFKEYITQEKIREYKKDYAGSSEVDALKTAAEEKVDSRIDKIHERLKNFLDNRARTVDLVCLLLVIEAFTPVFVTWIVFLGFVIREFLFFTASFYIVLKRRWAERQLKEKMEEIFRSTDTEAV